jgi:hypothetical protein
VHVNIPKLNEVYLNLNLRKTDKVAPSAEKFKRNRLSWYGYDENRGKVYD